MKACQGTEGYRLSQKCRKKVEECFGWLKTIGGLVRSRTVGRWKLQQLLEIGAAAFYLVRLRTLRPREADGGIGEPAPMSRGETVLNDARNDKPNGQGVIFSASC